VSLIDDVKRRAISSRAAQYLREKDAEWTTGYWIKNPDASSDPDKPVAIDAQGTMGEVRQWLSEQGFGSRFANKRPKTQVCVEGALLLGLAADESIPDSEYASSLLMEFGPSAADAAVDFGWIERDDFDGIPPLNDGNFDAEKAVNLLDRMAKD